MPWEEYTRLKVERLRELEEMEGDVLRETSGLLLEFAGLDSLETKSK